MLYYENNAQWHWECKLKFESQTFDIYDIPDCIMSYSQCENHLSCCACLPYGHCNCVILNV